MAQSGMQCGFCTPGMIMSAKHLLDSNPDPKPEEIQEGIAGNFCRCTGYTKIFESIEVAAIDEDTAEEAAQLIDVEYEELPGVFDPEEAMKEGAPQLYDHAKNNISWDFHMDFGDVEKGFRESDLVHEDRFETGRVISGYLEPPAAVVMYDFSGITI